MSIERCVEELYGDTLDEHCKKEEVARLKAEQGIQEIEEPGVNMSAEGFQVKVGDQNAGEGGKQGIPNEPDGVSGPSKGGE